MRWVPPLQSSYSTGDCASTLKCYGSAHHAVMVFTTLFFLAMYLPIVLPCRHAVAAPHPGFIMGIPHLLLGTLTARGVLAWSAKVLRFFTPCGSFFASLLANGVISCCLVLALDSRYNIVENVPAPRASRSGFVHVDLLLLVPSRSAVPPRAVVTRLKTGVALEHSCSGVVFGCVNDCFRRCGVVRRRYQLPLPLIALLALVEIFVTAYGVAAGFVYNDWIESQRATVTQQGTWCGWIALALLLLMFFWLLVMLWIRHETVEDDASSHSSEEQKVMKLRVTQHPSPLLLDVGARLTLTARGLLEPLHEEPAARPAVSSGNDSPSDVVVTHTLDLNGTRLPDSPASTHSAPLQTGAAPTGGWIVAPNGSPDHGSAVAPAARRAGADASADGMRSGTASSCGVRPVHGSTFSRLCRSADAIEDGDVVLLAGGLGDDVSRRTSTGSLPAHSRRESGSTLDAGVLVTAFQVPGGSDDLPAALPGNASSSPTQSAALSMARTGPRRAQPINRITIARHPQGRQIYRGELTPVVDGGTPASEDSSHGGREEIPMPELAADSAFGTPVAREDVPLALGTDASSLGESKAADPIDVIVSDAPAVCPTYTALPEEAIVGKGTPCAGPARCLACTCSLRCVVSCCRHWCGPRVHQVSVVQGWCATGAPVSPYRHSVPGRHPLR